MTPPLPLAEVVKKWKGNADADRKHAVRESDAYLAGMARGKQWCAEELEKSVSLAALPLGRCETCREWQPMDSAPMDGTRVLVRHRDTTYIASWGVAFIGDIRRATKSGWETDCGQDLQPTGWQPMPAPPAAGEETR